MIRLFAHHLPPPPSSQQVVSISQSFCVSAVERRLKRGDWREGGEGGRGAELYDREKAWPSIKHSILSGLFHSLQKKYWRIVTGQIGGENCMRRLAGPKDERDGLYTQAEPRPKFPPPDSIFNWKSVGALPADLYLFLSIPISLSPSPVIIMYVLGCQSSQLMLYKDAFRVL
jgi:hypothetical protein